MILVPQKLFDSEYVKVLLQDGLNCVLLKELDKSILNREAFISQHVINFIISGEQSIENEELLKVNMSFDKAVFITRDLYYITDLVSSKSSYKSLLFYLDDEIIQEFLSGYKPKVDKSKEYERVFRLRIDKELKQYFQSFLNIYNRNNSRKQLTRIKILELLHLLSQANPNFEDFLFNIQLPKKRRIAEFMKQNFDKPLKVEDYAYLTGRSLTSFRREFRAQFNASPSKWLQELRLEKAKALLDNGIYNVSQVAQDVGYVSTSYFISMFKNSTGLSPKQYILNKQNL